MATVVSVDGGQTLTPKHKGDRTQTIHVRPGVPIVTVQSGQRGDAKPGTRIFTAAQNTTDGGLTAACIAVGKDDMQPPM